MGKKDTTSSSSVAFLIVVVPLAQAAAKNPSGNSSIESETNFSGTLIP